MQNIPLQVGVSNPTSKHGTHYDTEALSQNIETNSISIQFPGIQEKLFLKVPMIVLDQTLGQIS